MSDLETTHRAVRRAANGGRMRLAIGIGLCTSLIASVALGGVASAAEPEIPPIVTTSPAVAVAGGYTLAGTIYTYSLDTTYHFEYGTTTAYGTSVPVPDADAGTDPVVPVSQTVSGLAPNTSYHFRIVADNSKGPGDSPDATFTTAADPSAPPPAGPVPTAPAPPAREPVTGGSGNGKVVKLKAVKNSGGPVLATATGRSLYTLSAEKNGKFICTKASGCLAIWHPLMVPDGATLTGPVMLGTIKRPEGGTQATYHGMPLYTFVSDTKPGQVKGQGLKDVGTWHVAKVPTQKR
jgi:predicted lipoprotein with Yx(FWY)xxD motif